jgi:hypothetical protein
VKDSTSTGARVCPTGNSVRCLACTLHDGMVGNTVNACGFCRCVRALTRVHASDSCGEARCRLLVTMTVNAVMSERAVLAPGPTMTAMGAAWPKGCAPSQPIGVSHTPIPPAPADAAPKAADNFSCPPCPSHGPASRGHHAQAHTPRTHTCRVWQQHRASEPAAKGHVRHVRA